MAGADPRCWIYCSVPTRTFALVVKPNFCPVNCVGITLRLRAPPSSRMRVPGLDTLTARSWLTTIIPQRTFVNVPGGGKSSGGIDYSTRCGEEYNDETA